VLNELHNLMMITNSMLILK